MNKNMAMLIKPPGKKKAKGKKGPSPRKVLGQTGRDGVVVVATATDLDDFLNEPAENDVATAQGMAEAVAKTGIPELSPELRGAQARVVDPNAKKLAADVARGLDRVPAVASVVGVTGAKLRENQAKEVEVNRLDEAVQLAMGYVKDSKLVLEAWQYQARSTAGGLVFVALTDKTKPQAYRTQLLFDAAEVLRAEEDFLAEYRGVRQTGTAAVQGVQTQLDEEENAVVLLQTLRDLRAKRAVPEDRMQQAAAYFTERYGSGEASVGGPNKRSSGR